MSYQSSGIEDRFPVRVYDCGCVLAHGGVPEELSVSALVIFTKCEAWKQAYTTDDLERADAWAEKHYEETPHRIEFRTARG
jgi:hypothetical protein